MYTICSSFLVVLFVFIITSSLYPCLCSLCVSNPINIALNVNSTDETLVLSHSVPLAPRSAGIPSPGSFISLQTKWLRLVKAQWMLNLLLVVVIRGDSCRGVVPSDHWSPLMSS
eukprot:1050364_1